MFERQTNLAFIVATLIVAVRSGTERGTRLIATGDASSLCKILLTFRTADLDLLLLAAAAELIRLESALRFEGGATMLGDILVGHDGWLTLVWLTGYASVFWGRGVVV
jgi:hypothetical protein